jgi:DNA mismatch repair protein MutS
MARSQSLRPPSHSVEARPGASGPFESVLFADSGPDTQAGGEPDSFSDLNLDQVVEAITLGKEEYELKEFFHVPLHSVSAVEYRHDVCRDLEREDVRRAIVTFAEGMQRARRYFALAGKQRYRYEKERWFLDAACLYCSALSDLANELADLELASSGLQGLRTYLSDSLAAEPYRALETEAAGVREGLARVRYSLKIKGPRVTVSHNGGEPDYSLEVERDFERFRQGDVDEHRFDLRDPGSMDHVEARIAERVARLFPEEFRALDDFFAAHPDFFDTTIVRFDREVQFYLAYLDFSDRLGEQGLAFTYPAVSTDSKEISAEDAFDLALAVKLDHEGTAVVTNDFLLRGQERVLVVTGPNQGGKTTFARMFGQLHWLAALGLPVPAREAQVFLPDRIFTHFEQEENIETLRGKLDDELVRIRDILQEATTNSVVLLNEMFSSTTLQDGIVLGTDVLERIIERGSLGVCVTFIDELTELGEAIVSMVAAVAPDDPAKRTFKIVRRPADGRAYAVAIAEKYVSARKRCGGEWSDEALAHAPRARPRRGRTSAGQRGRPDAGPRARHHLRRDGARR